MNQYLMVKFWALSYLCISGLCISLLGIGVSAAAYSIQEKGNEDTFASAVKSCMHARVPDINGNSFCPFAHWLSATVYSSSNFTFWDPGPALTDVGQNSYAMYLNDKILKSATGAVTSECSGAVQRFACIEAYPECPESGISISGISYFMPCRIQCEQVNVLCAHSIHIDCSRLPVEDCMGYVPNGYFLLSPRQGPYDPLPYIYGVALFCWALMATSWNYLTFVTYRNSCVSLCRAVGGIPIVKVIVLSFGLSFWTTCVEWDMCPFWMGVSLINTHLVYETGQMVIFLLVAKGWSITRETFSAAEWRGVIMSMSGFYMANSIILVLDTSILSTQGFWVANAILYGFVYGYIYHSVLQQLVILRDQVSVLGDDMPSDITRPLKMKYLMYQCFMAVVLVSMIMEICCHSLLHSDGRMWVVLLAYEISNVIILFTLGWTFRPREYSPFFFMVPARLTDDRTRPIPTLEANDEADDDAEVELMSLMQSDDAVFVPSKMIIVRNPSLSVSVGISANIPTNAGNTTSVNRFSVTTRDAEMLT